MEYITEDDVLNLGPIDFMIKVRDFLAENAKDSIFEEEKKGIKNLLLERFSLSDKELIKDIRENIAERVNKMLAQKN